ncbi:TonB-dependent receptor [Arenibacter sp. F26102]|uniref:TonB-dependent receptor plug domain-containing protein n=1 Tax=Arenibacter sp. F26102 TaxID=2926416 RepID=UPI001FF647F1|nr:TonB-dependent receptor [Arenibacter sp. F26102]MCK0145549.1 TonB-dependent receptor [Arenibacter sp. F26102]
MTFSNNRPLNLPFAFVFCFSIALSFGQDNTSSTRDTVAPHSLDEVVITANRFGTFQNKTPEAIEVVHNNTIQRFQLRTAPEALLLSPGVFVQKTNHGGGSPFVRGLTGNQTLLLYDGIRLNNATVRSGPNQYFNTIDVFSVGKMEVLRGSGSVQYGSDAIGGTIQALSRELKLAPKPLWGTDLFTRLVTQGMEQTVNGALKYSDKRMAFRANATWRNFGDLVGGDTTGQQSPTGYRELNFDLKGKILLNDRSNLTTVYQRVHQRDVPVYHKVALEDYAINRMDPQKRELAYARLHQDLNNSIFKSALVTASFQQNEEGRILQKNGSSLERTENDKVRTFGFSAETRTSSGEIWSANSGVEVYSDKVKSSRTDKDLSTNTETVGRGLYPDGATMTSIAAFSMHTLSLQQWEITAGGRFNTFINKVTDSALGTTKLTPSALVGNLAVQRSLNQSSNIFASINTGFRAPNINDLGSLGIVDFRYETPNFDLKPEHSLQYQVGYKFRNRLLKAEVFLYRNELNDLIVRHRIEGDSIEGYPVYQKKNVERGFVQGAEMAWDLTLNPTWKFSGNLTYTYGQNKTSDEPARRIPPLFGRLATEYGVKNWAFNVDWLIAGKQDRLASGDLDDNRIPLGGTPGWNVLNLHTSYTFSYVTIDLGLQNIFNEDYRYHGSGVNGYGRSGVVSVSARL